MSRKTTFRFTAVDDAALNQVFARHAGARRFAYNQCRRMVTEALQARKADPDLPVPWSGYDLINAFNSWKVSEAAGRVFAVDSTGSAEIARTGLIWRSEVCSGVFEEAAVDLGRGLAAYSDSRRGVRRGPKMGFPRFKRKASARRSFRLRNRISKSGHHRIRVGETGPRSTPGCCAACCDRAPTAPRGAGSGS
ncbi:MAG TPA: hypothetical protein VFH50_08090 [Acidimicrobiales bacterium]|nr:hypothetical protein [Acidimicrobiales bacterium]